MSIELDFLHGFSLLVIDRSREITVDLHQTAMTQGLTPGHGSKGHGGGRRAIQTVSSPPA